MAEIEWRKLINDPSEKLVFEALEDDRWDWRTLRALTKASGLSENDVLKIINKYPTLVRKSITPIQSGENLYTLQERYFKRKSLLKKSWDFLSTLGLQRKKD